MPKNKAKIAGKTTRSIEKISHFNCALCKKWWSIGDAPLAKKNWFCPWCGTKLKI